MTTLSLSRAPCTAVIGGGTMGADVAVVLSRGGLPVTVVERDAAKAAGLPAYIGAQLEAAGCAAHAGPIAVVHQLEDVAWAGIGLVVECIVEQLAPKQQLFARLVELAPPSALLTSNSSGLPISRIADGLPTRGRMFGLHFFMPAHLVPLVEVVMGPDSDADAAQALMQTMRRCASVPVLVRKDRPGFLANRLQHALAREAFALLDDGVASVEDIDAAVRFGFGFRFLAAGPILQRDHAGLDVHCAAAATIYPSLCNDDQPAKVLQQQVQAGRVGMKAGAGFSDWPEAERAAERARYDRLLRAGLQLLADELPPLPGAAGAPSSDRNPT
ncbi:MAG: 3-hydroxyacyl-CoA dehydrogenase [Pseudacidovorax sp.]|uniref:3-hydroxyacyl-CoA dehydrogenase family protein n=1 Tax=Pseudacidovorax sp. TaxID=1934311 RepID=UPI001B5D16A9|nr:3-hydroxyacyl-CoA dehydrogenase NAD-binding domain-containing protein [Pseudacidovorax sp.]MBP6895532.1 3-hydroxyacyl-CoA dehydrogenase [Pseudacidovorax sp.]